MTEAIRLASGNATADIAVRGAEVLAWRCDGRDVLWHGDARFWPRIAPVLFPFCGWLNGGAFRHNGETFAATVHGFGPDAVFAAETRRENALRLHLRDTAATRAHFPFAFLLAVDITLDGNRLAYAFNVANPGGEPLPYALGFHPGFRWPFDGGDKQDYRIVFAQPERPFAERIAPGGLFTGEKRPVAMDGAALDIAAALRTQDSLVLLDARSQKLGFVAPSGARLDIVTENFPHWVFWSLPGAEYLCIEGWTGQGDPVGFTGDLAAKPGMTWLAPGESLRHSFAVTFRAAQI